MSLLFLPVTVCQVVAARHGGCGSEEQSPAEPEAKGLPSWPLSMFYWGKKQNRNCSLIMLDAMIRLCGKPGRGTWQRLEVAAGEGRLSSEDRAEASLAKEKKGRSRQQGRQQEQRYGETKGMARISSLCMLRERSRRALPTAKADYLRKIRLCRLLPSYMYVTILFEFL